MCAGPCGGAGGGGGTLRGSPKLGGRGCLGPDRIWPGFGGGGAGLDGIGIPRGTPGVPSGGTIGGPGVAGVTVPASGAALWVTLGVTVWAPVCGAVCSATVGAAGAGIPTECCPLANGGRNGGANGRAGDGASTGATAAGVPMLGAGGG